MPLDQFIILSVLGVALVGFASAYLTLFSINVLATRWENHEQARLARCIREGRCIQCGYDVRASRAHCPECGTAISADPTPQTPTSPA